MKGDILLLVKGHSLMWPAVLGKQLPTEMLRGTKPLTQNVDSFSALVQLLQLCCVMLFSVQLVLQVQY